MQHKTNSEISADVQQTFDTLQKIIANCDENYIDSIPFDKGWSIGQTAEHILKSSSGFSYFCKDNTVPTDRDFADKIPAIKALFLDYTTKMESPKEILPTETKHDKERILQELEAAKQEILMAINAWDLSLTCLTFEFPGFGYLTRLEWIYFILYHTQRHTFQIQNVLLKL